MEVVRAREGHVGQTTLEGALSTPRAGWKKHPKGGCFFLVIVTYIGYVCCAADLRVVLLRAWSSELSPWRRLELH